MNRLSSLVAIATFCILWFSVSKGVAGESIDDGSVWLATISVSKYPRLPQELQLEYCDEDAKAIVERFVESRCVNSERLCQLRAGERSTNLPTKENIMRELPHFLDQAGPSDTVVLFFSMHGLQVEDAGGSSRPKTFLLPADVEFSPNREISNVIPMEWLRNQLHATRAQRVIVFLDACHSGGINSTVSREPVSPLTSKSIETVFREAPQQDTKKKIYVLASCRDHQVSLESPMLKHGIFTHWLTCGFDGAADSNADGLITMDELFGFVERQVPKSAQYLSRVARDTARRGENTVSGTIEQNPVRFFFGQDQGDIVVMPVAPKPISNALKRTSEMLDFFLRSHLYHEAATVPSRIGIVEFGLQAADGMQDLRGKLGSFGAISRDIVDKELNRISESSQDYHKPVYRIAAGRDLKQKLKGFDVNIVESVDLPPEALEIQGEAIDALLCGRYLRRGGSTWDPGPDRMELDLTLLDTRSKTKIARIQTVILVNAEFLAMLGGSIDQRQTPKPASSSSVNHLTKVEQPSDSDFADASQVTADIQTPSEIDELPNPEIQHPQFRPQEATLSIRVFQNSPTEKPQLTPWLPPDPHDPNWLVFRTKEGKEITLEIKNNTADSLAFVVQIDGVNQIGRSVASPDRSPYWLIQPHATARIDQWLDELSNNQIHGNTRTLDGKRLVIVSAPQSVASQRKISESLGEIRVIAYGARSRSSKSSGSSVPGLGVGEGNSQRNQYPVVRNLQIDTSDLRAIYVLRYQQ